MHDDRSEEQLRAAVKSPDNVHMRERRPDDQRAKSIAIGLGMTLFVLLFGITALELTGTTSLFGPRRVTADVPPSPSLSPSALVTPTATASAAPSPSASKPAPSPTPARGIPRDSFVQVVTDDLRVRSKPGIGTDSVKLEPLLWKGALAFVIRGPVKASGYEWYLVEPLGEVDLSTHPDPPQLGWVAAAAKSGERWLDRTSFGCDPNPLRALDADFDWPPSNMVALGCVGNTPQHFVAGIGARQEQCGVEARWTITPSWLDPCAPRYVLVDESPHDYTDLRTLPIVIDPAVRFSRLSTLKPGTFLAVDVTGHYDHAAARTCRARLRAGAEGPTPPVDLVVRRCRTEFVVTALRVHVDS